MNRAAATYSKFNSRRDNPLSALLQATCSNPARLPEAVTHVAPLTSSINFRPSIVRANNVVVPLGAGGKLPVQCGMPSGSTN